MPHSVGGTQLPLPIPEIATNASADSVLDTVGEAFSAILQAQLGPAWDAIHGGNFAEQILKFDPEAVYDTQVQPDDSIFPALYVYSQTIGSTRLTDSMQETETELSLLWVPNTRETNDNTLVDSFFLPFCKVIASVVQRGRDPSWVSDDDAGIDGDTAAQAFGSDIRKKCGFDRWTQLPKDAVQRKHFTIQQVRYDGFWARITAYETSNFDLAAAGYFPVSLEATFNSGGTTPLSLGGFLKPPAT